MWICSDVIWKKSCPLYRWIVSIQTWSTPTDHSHKSNNALSHISQYTIQNILTFALTLQSFFMDYHNTKKRSLFLRVKRWEWKFSRQSCLQHHCWWRLGGHKINELCRIHSRHLIWNVVLRFMITVYSLYDGMVMGYTLTLHCYNIFIMSWWWLPWLPWH